MCKQKTVDDVLPKEEQDGVLALAALNRMSGIKYVYKFEFFFWRWKIRVEQRSKKNLWGRFGGGWNFELGIQVSRRSFILNYGVGSIRISLREKYRR